MGKDLGDSATFATASDSATARAGVNITHVRIAALCSAVRDRTLRQLSAETLDVETEPDTRPDTILEVSFHGCELSLAEQTEPPGFVSTALCAFFTGFNICLWELSTELTAEYLSNIG